MSKRRKQPPAERGDVGEESLAPEEPLALTLYLREPGRPRRRPGSGPEIAELTRRISREELERRRSRLLAAPIAEIREFAARHGMTVAEVDPLRRQVKLVAPAAVAERAFTTKLRREASREGNAHYPKRAPRLPSPLAGTVRAVLGLDTRPRIGRLRAMAGTGGANGLYPTVFAQLYGLVTKGRGAGQSIALIEPAGGYDRDDLAAACRAMKVPVPVVTDVNVGPGHNAFGADAQADREVSLDLQVLAAVAPEARIAVYFTENSEAALADGVTQAVHDAANRPSVIVITWGEPEEAWSDAARAALDAALRDAMRLGITVVTAAGDNLATDRVPDNKAHVDYPASSPYVLGCGGSAITLDATGGTIADEVVWNEGLRGTGGGVSAIYPVPAFQKSVQLPTSVNDGRPGRGVPDVCAAAAEKNGYRIVLKGAEIVASGTSAVAPLWGAFVALINEQRGETIGFINSALYRDPTLLRTITTGDNIIFGIGYEAGPGWSACAGLGAPIGATILAGLTAQA